MLPNRVYSQHGGGGFMFENALTPAMLAPRLRHNEVLGEQCALTAWGPVLVDYPTMLAFRDSGFNSIEMEAGAYLACCAEHLAGLATRAKARCFACRICRNAPRHRALRLGQPFKSHAIVEPIPWPLRCAAGLCLWRSCVEAYSGRGVNAVLSHGRSLSGRCGHRIKVSVQPMPSKGFFLIQAEFFQYVPFVHRHCDRRNPQEVAASLELIPKSAMRLSAALCESVSGKSFAQMLLSRMY